MAAVFRSHFFLGVPGMGDPHKTEAPLRPDRRKSQPMTKRVCCGCSPAFYSNSMVYASIVRWFKWDYSIEEEFGAMAVDLKNYSTFRFS